MSRPKKYEISLTERNLKNILENYYYLVLLEVIYSANKFCRKVNKTRSTDPLLKDLRTCSSYLDEVNRFIQKVIKEDDNEVILKTLHITRNKLLLKRDNLFSRLEDSSVGTEVVTIRIASEKKMKISEIE